MTAVASSVTELVILRVLAGLGMGGIVPAVMAYGFTEFAPQRLKATVVAFVRGWRCRSAACSVDSALQRLLPVFGWQAIFVVAGVTPLALSLVLAFIMPESLAYLSAHGGDQVEDALDRGAHRASAARRCRALHGRGNCPACR